jgi:hypothetical protein
LAEDETRGAYLKIVGENSYSDLMGTWKSGGASWSDNSLILTSTDCEMYVCSITI